MASDRTRELAKQWLVERDLYDEDDGADQYDLDSLVALLDAFERQVRGEEANTCVDILAAHLKAMDIQSRIAELSAQPTPEVKNAK